jgi:phosphoglycolate phosphatase-like HAD superfamily hydrolase
MLRSAAKRLHLRLPDCWMVGDKESDVAAAHAAGCRAVRIGGSETAAEATAGDLLHAARIILKEG